MNALGVILARAGSKGLKHKCLRDLLGRPVIAYTFDHVAASRRLTAAVLTTDSEPAQALARKAGLEVVHRPPQLASDTAPVDAAARHAVTWWEQTHGRTVTLVVLLYGNIPVRAPDLIDRAIEHLAATGADSVRSVAPVGKHHPDWLHRLDGDRMSQLRPNSIHRRQDLQPLYYHDGAVAAVTRQALFGALATPDDHQAFLGRDRRALVQQPEDAVDIDAPMDLHVAEALLRARRASGAAAAPSAGWSSGGPRGSAGEPGQSQRSRGAAAAEPKVPPVIVERHCVGPGERTFIVAEAGVNHNGCVDTALRLVDAAVDAGADAVKFQMFRAADLATASAPTAAYQHDATGEASQRALLSRLELSPAEFARVKEHCDRRSILFLATPFGKPEVARLVELGASAIKIASTDVTNGPLLDAAAGTGLPMILSTGASTEDEIRRSISRLRQHGADGRLILLHCVSCYPTPVESLNLRAASTLRRTFMVPCGLSDHTTSVEVGSWAAAAGACLLEKHFALDAAGSGPDHAVSLTPDQLAAYIHGVRRVERAAGDGRLGMAPCEREVRAVASKSVVAATDIPAGTALTADLLTLKRPGTGIPADHLDRLVGRRAAVHISCDTMLSWEMVE